MGHDDVVSSMVLELRRGTIVLCVLGQLDAPCYGYALVQCLQAQGMPVEAGTLYPLLRRLEKQGMLRSQWETAGAKPRKYYCLTEQGRTLYAALLDAWASLNDSIALLTGGKGSKT